tara:strand:- start:895 stop:1146 length:252 start_codon:yes stop_codon:yes gene_type:complete
MSSDKESTMFIGDKEVKESDMTDQQKYFARQIQDLRAKKAKIDFDADQIVAALNVFQNELIKSVQDSAEKVLEEDSTKTKGGK